MPSWFISRCQGLRQRYRWPCSLELCLSSALALVHDLNLSDAALSQPHQGYVSITILTLDRYGFPTSFLSCYITGMSKIVVNGPVVELDGDEMTRIIWKKIREEVSIPRSRPYSFISERTMSSLTPSDPPWVLCSFFVLTSYSVQLILPYLDLNIKYYDLGLEHRDKVGPKALNARHVDLTLSFTDKWSSHYWLGLRDHWTQGRNKMCNHYTRWGQSKRVSLERDVEEPQRYRECPCVLGSVPLSIILYGRFETSSVVQSSANRSSCLGCRSLYPAG